jgi:hypothetical protein
VHLSGYEDLIYSGGPPYVEEIPIGFDEHSGALGIEATHIFGPEVGTLGILVNTIAVLALAYWWRRRT